jgi:hypothetical protein
MGPFFSQVSAMRAELFFFFASEFVFRGAYTTYYAQACEMKDLQPNTSLVKKKKKKSRVSSVVIQYTVLGGYAF